MASSYMRFLDHTQRRTTVGRTPLDEWSARHRDLYLTTHTKDKRPCLSGGIRTHNLSRQAAADPWIWSLGHWDRQFEFVWLTQMKAVTRKIPRAPFKEHSVWNSQERFWCTQNRHWQRWLMDFYSQMLQSRVPRPCELVHRFQSNAGLSRPL